MNLTLLFAGLLAHAHPHPPGEFDYQKLWAFLDAPKASPAALNQLSTAGAMDGYFTLAEVDQLLAALSARYPQFVQQPFVIGETHQQRKISAFRLGRLADASRRSAVLLTALHHAREPTSLAMVLRLLFSSLHGLIHPDRRESAPPAFFDVCELLFLPVVNPDAYHAIGAAHGSPQWRAQRERRKNLSPGAVCAGNEVSSGVDINRNYDVSFDADEVGSVGGNACDDVYRGAAPFSEPEARAVKALVEEHGLHVSAALNFHAFGNMWIWPYSHHAGPDNEALLSPAQAGFYRRLRARLLERGVTAAGNAIQTIQYTANGEASDWMLKAHGILALSPELGDGTPASSQFFLPRHKLADVLSYSERIVGDFLAAALPAVHAPTFRAVEGHEPRGHHHPALAADRQLFKVSFENNGSADMLDARLTLRYFHPDFAASLRSAVLVVGGKRTPLHFKAGEPSALLLSPAVDLQRLALHTLLLEFSPPVAVKCRLQAFKGKALLLDVSNYSGNELVDVYSAFRRERAGQVLAWLLLVKVFVVLMWLSSCWLSRRRELRKAQHILEFANVIRAEVEHNVSDQNMSFQSHC